MWEPKYVTVVSGDSPDYCVDGLADGFMRWLGKERVHLHLNVNSSGQNSEFDNLQHIYAWNQESHRLRWKPCESDLLVLSTRNHAAVTEWIEAQRFHCMLASIDSKDFPINETHTCSLNGREAISFKREVSYTSMSLTTYPCPTSLIPDNLIFLKPYRDRSIPVTFMGGSSNITRPAMATALQTIPGSKVLLNEPLPRTEYLAILEDSKIGVSCYGAGFESYRYWEIPQAGCLLVAQTPPILIPRNFQDGRHAIFYMSPIEMLNVVKWALGHEQEAEAIALAGTRHLHQYHESIHRAKWLTAVIEDCHRNPQTSERLIFPF